MSEYPAVAFLEQEVTEHGEAHATFEEYEDEVEIRDSTTVFDYEQNVIRVEAPSHSALRFHMESLVGYELPQDPFH